MSGLAGALCRGKWWLFDSTLESDHREAASICATCPAIAACQALLENVRGGAMGVVYSGPVGTWAGELVGTKRAKGQQPHPREHRTDRGYYQHRQRNEKACDACLEAHRFTQWLRNRYGVSA